MMSLNQRILYSATLVLLVFIIGIALTLDRAFYDSARLGVQDRMFAQLLVLMGDAEINKQGSLHMPTNILDRRLTQPSSGTYAFIIDQTVSVAWKSLSALNKTIPPITPLARGIKKFSQINIDNKPHFIYSFGISWTTKSGVYPLTFNVVTDTTLFESQIESYRENLWGGLSIMVLLLLITQMLVLRWGLKPMQEVSNELAAIESGEQENVKGIYPRELKLLTDNINSLINHERKQQKRYRNGLADLAHSLKTPLAILQGTADTEDNTKENKTTVEEQVLRMNNIVQYQLRRAATSGSTSGMRLIILRPIVERIIHAVEKAYPTKHPTIKIDIDNTLSLRIDEGDLMELLGNLIDNAYKWCQQEIIIHGQIEENTLTITINDDGPGIHTDQIEKILERGVRADQSIPGHGIGLAIVRDILDVYGGQLSISQNEPQGTRVVMQIART